MDDTTGTDSKGKPVSLRDKIRGMRSPQRRSKKSDLVDQTLILSLEAQVKLAKMHEDAKNQLVTHKAVIDELERKVRDQGYDIVAMRSELARVKTDLEKMTYTVSPSDSLREALKF